MASLKEGTVRVQEGGLSLRGALLFNCQGPQQPRTGWGRAQQARIPGIALSA